jgi:BASS family bile acid:Na+ symporter
MMSQIGLPAGLALIMFAMGLTLTVGDFRLVVAQPRAVAVGLVAQMVVLPLLALALIFLFPTPAEFAVGLIILAVCPAGITSSLLTHLAHGHTALAATLTAVTSLAGTVTIPFFVNLALVHLAGAAQAAELPVARMTLGVFAVATLPLLAAMAVRHRWPGLAGRWEGPLRRVATVVFAAIVLGAFASQWTYLMGYFAQVIPPTLALNVGAMILAALLAWLVRVDRAQRVATIMVTGLRNGALGIFVAATLLGNEAMMVPSILYALVMNVTAIAFILVARRRRVQSSRIER